MNNDIDYTLANRLIIVGGSLVVAIALFACLIGCAWITASLIA